MIFGSAKAVWMKGFVSLVMGVIYFIFTITKGLF